MYKLVISELLSKKNLSVLKCPSFNINKQLFEQYPLLNLKRTERTIKGIYPIKTKSEVCIGRMHTYELWHTYNGLKNDMSYGLKNDMSYGFSKNDGSISLVYSKPTKWNGDTFVYI